MTAERGEVWWGPALHKGTSAYRPWLIVSNSTHPFASEECIALAMTTQEHESGVSVPDRAWVDGGSDVETYVSPWYVTTIKHDDFDRKQGTLRDELVEEVVDELQQYTARRDR